MDPEVRITTKSDGETYIGIPVSRGPETFRLLLTWPYKSGGHIKAIPVEDIGSIDKVESGPLREEPQPH